MRILFIGNSHTYFNDMPAMVAGLAEACGRECQVTMIAHGGWFLLQHLGEPEVRFNILKGGYDYVVLQEHAHPFGPMEDFCEALTALCRWIREAGSTPVLFMPWSRKDEPGKQAELSAAHRQAAEALDMLLVPVGDQWWEYQKEHPEAELYFTDGAHASPAGSRLAAAMIWEMLSEDYRVKVVGDASSAANDLSYGFLDRFGGDEEESMRELRELRSVIEDYWDEE